MIYEHTLTLLSLLRLIFTIYYFIFLLMKIVIGKAIRGTIKVKIAGQPTLIPMIILPPIKPIGNIIPAKTNGSFV